MSRVSKIVCDVRGCSNEYAGPLPFAGGVDYENLYQGWTIGIAPWLLEHIGSALLDQIDLPDSIDIRTQGLQHTLDICPEHGLREECEAWNARAMKTPTSTP